MSMPGGGANLLQVLQQALVAHQAGNAADAERLYKRVLRVAPGQFDALHLLGVLKAERGLHEEADRLIKRALQTNPRSPEALNNHANVLWSMKRLEEALTSCEGALAIRPDFPEAWNNRGNILHDLARPEDALASYDKAVVLRPDYATALVNRADVLRDLQRFQEALASCERALAIRPGFAKALVNRAILLMDFRRNDEALASLEQALKIEPGKAETYHYLGNAVYARRRYDAAIASYRRAFEIDARHGTARSLYVFLKRQICDWSTSSRDESELIEALAAGARSVLPLVVISTIDDPAIQLDAARRYVVANKFDRQTPPLGLSPRTAGDKIRIAYCSADFRDHTMSVSLAQLLELHDRSRFETYGISFGIDDGSDMRKRMMRAFDRFFDVRTMSDLDVARQIAAIGIDIAVDLAGFTRGCRPGILAYRPAPIQVNYLAYPGTTGAKFIDYILVDPFIVPVHQQAYFEEALVFLPDCYLPSDTSRRIAEPAPGRAACGLPEHGLVFAAFNDGYKITSSLFDVWMRLLGAFPGAVLWLRADNNWMKANLRREASARGISPDRLVFAGRLPLPEHLARHGLADLFLDTLTYNGHSTAIDALWAGLPVVTCEGRSFAARAAGSLLRSAGLSELLTTSLKEYEAVARRLAGDPSLRTHIRERLANARSTSPLFDTPRLCRHIESAYQEMYARWRRGEPAQSFSVPALPA